MPIPTDDGAPGLWRPPGHYYSPIVDVADVAQRAARLFDRRRPGVPGVEPDLEAMQKLIEGFISEDGLADIPWGESPRPGLRYHFDNDQFRHEIGEHPSGPQSPGANSYAVLCLKKKKAEG